MPVSELVQRMTAAEEVHWFALWGLEPWGDFRGDVRSAQVAQLIYNSNSKKPKKLEEFMMFRDKPAKPGDDPQTIRKNFERLIAAQKKRRG